MCLGFHHPDSLTVARPRCEVACVACARKDWLENRFQVYLWIGTSDSTVIGELIHGPGTTELLVHEGHLCFGSRDRVNKYLATSLYAALMPKIPEQHLYASSVVHPADPTMQWLLHTRRVPLQREDSAAQSVLPQAASVAQPALPHPCAGVGNPDETAWICLECACCLCVDDKLIKMPKLALANLMWLGREPRLLQTASLGLRMLLGGSRACFRTLLFSAKVRRRTGNLAWLESRQRHQCCLPRLIHSANTWLPSCVEALMRSRRVDSQGLKGRL